jgi:hypothetical protein
MTDYQYAYGQPNMYGLNAVDQYNNVDAIIAQHDNNVGAAMAPQQTNMVAVQQPQIS